MGSRVGQSLLEALAPLRAGLCLIGTNSIPEAANLFACDRARLLPETRQAEDFEAALAALIEAEAPDLVLACRDADLPALSRLSLRFPGRIPVPPPDLMPVFADKYESWRFALRHELPFATSAFTPDEARALLAGTGLPLVAKPRWGGHASKHVYLVQSRDQLAAVLRTERFLIQELLAPASLELDADFGRLGLPWVHAVADDKRIAELVIGRDGEVVSLSASGTRGSELGSTPWELLPGSETAEIERVALAYARQLGAAGLRGPLNLQGKLLADGRFVVYELNARFTGSASARSALGYNQVGHLLAHYLAGAGPEVPQRPGPALKAAKIPQRYIALNEEDIASLRATGQWQAASA